VVLPGKWDECGMSLQRHHSNLRVKPKKEKQRCWGVEASGLFTVALQKNPPG
jgi:hypothetical protein